MLTESERPARAVRGAAIVLHEIVLAEQLPNAVQNAAGAAASAMGESASVPDGCASETQVMTGAAVCEPPAIAVCVWASAVHC